MYNWSHNGQIYSTRRYWSCYSFINICMLCLNPALSICFIFQVFACYSFILVSFLFPLFLKSFPSFELIRSIYWSICFKFRFRLSAYMLLHKLVPVQTWAYEVPACQHRSLPVHTSDLRILRHQLCESADHLWVERWDTLPIIQQSKTNVRVYSVNR